MAPSKPSLLDRLIEGYEVAKKPIAYVVMLVALLLQSLPADLIPAAVQDITYPAVLVVLALILMQILFEIYEKIVKSQKELNIIDSNELYRKILDIVSSERRVTIKYLGVAGRHGWTNVIEKLLNENKPESLIANRTRFEIDVALLDPNEHKTNDRVYRRFQAVSSVSEAVSFAANHVVEIAPDSELRLHFYTHMPNMLGFLINENYLFVTYTYWEYLQGELTLRAGGTDYFVYDKNDDFGGQEVIKRFSGWYDFILESAKGHPEAGAATPAAL